MPEITPEPAVSDPSDPRWAPPDGNRITVDHSDAPVAEVERG